MKLYGSLENRIMETAKDPEITKGMGATVVYYTDREPYEVTEVKDQKHVTVRKLDAKHTGEAFENRWELSSNENNPEIELTKRGEVWYEKQTVTRETLENADTETKFWICLNGFNPDRIREAGSQTKYSKLNIKFGYASKHYDYSF